MHTETLDVITPCRPPPQPRRKGTFVPRERPRAAVEKPVLCADLREELLVDYTSGTMPSEVLGLAWQNVEAADATALVVTDGTSAVCVANEKISDFLRLHANHVLVPSAPDWFMLLHGCPAAAWELAPDKDAPAPGLRFIALPMLWWALRQKKERLFDRPLASMAQTVAFARGPDKFEVQGLRDLLEAGLAASPADTQGKLAGEAKAALLLFKTFLRRIQRKGARRDKILARLARYRAQLPVVIQEQIFGVTQPELATSGEPTASAMAPVNSGNIIAQLSADGKTSET